MTAPAERELVQEQETKTPRAQDKSVTRGSGIAKTKGAAKRAQTTAAPTTTVQLLLRDVSIRVAGALRESGIARDGALLVAAAELRQVLREVVNQSLLGPVDWNSIQPELQTALAAKRALLRELQGAALQPIRLELADASWGVKRALPKELAATIDSAAAVPLASVREVDRVHLVQMLLAGCRKRITVFKGMKGTDDEKSAHDVCAQLALDLNSATDAVLAIHDRRVRAEMRGELAALEDDLEWLESFLSQAPRMKWHPTFAAVFDAENGLRKVAGLAPKVRAYSGRIDPKAALNLAKDLAKNERPESLAKKEFVDPQSAVAGVRAGIIGVFDAQRRALDDLEKNLEEKEIPRQPTIYERLLKAAVDLALSGAALGLGNLAEKGVLALLNHGAKSKVVNNEYLEHLLDKEHWARDRILTSALTEGAARRALVASGAGNAVGGLFNAVSTHVREAGKQVTARDPKPAYFQLQRSSLAFAHMQSELALAHLQNAIAQADLDELNALVHLIAGELVRKGYDLQYSHSLKEWLNFRAHLTTNTAAELDVNLLREPVPGALEVRLLIDPEPGTKPHLRDIKLTDGEPAAKRRLRHLAEPIEKSGVHVRYLVRFHWGHGGQQIVCRGQAPGASMEHGHQDATEIALLRLRADNQRLTASSVHAARLGYVHYISVEAANAELARSLRDLHLKTNQIEL